MQVICTFFNEPAVTLEVPAGTRWVYIARDTAGGAKLVTHDTDALRTWMNDPARVAPWIEPQEVIPAADDEPSLEMEVERVA